MGEGVARFPTCKSDPNNRVFFARLKSSLFCPLLGVVRAKKKHFQHLLPCYYNCHAYSLYSLQYSEDIN